MKAKLATDSNKIRNKIRYKIYEVLINLGYKITILYDKKKRRRIWRYTYIA